MQGVLYHVPASIAKDTQDRLSEALLCYTQIIPDTVLIESCSHEQVYTTEVSLLRSIKGLLNCSMIQQPESPSALCSL